MYLLLLSQSGGSGGHPHGSQPAAGPNPLWGRLKKVPAPAVEQPQTGHGPLCPHGPWSGPKPPLAIATTGHWQHAESGAGVEHQNTHCVPTQSDPFRAAPGVFLYDHSLCVLTKYTHCEVLLSSGEGVRPPTTS